MAVLIPTKKIPQLTAYGVPLAGPEMLEIWATGTSRRVTARDFVLPIDSLVTIAGQGADIPGSRQLVDSTTVTVVDGGAGGTVMLESTFTGALAGNPTASIGLAAINGVALTWMRSDAAPPLSQAIAPTWTALHIFTNGTSPNNPSMRWESARPIVTLIESDAAADNRSWFMDANAEQFRIAVLNDAGSASTVFLAVDRTLNVVDSIALTSTALTWNGSPLLSAATAFANPTASVGLAAVNGAATTAMRSDAAPALSQAIAPTWTAQHIFSLSGATNAAIFASSAQPQIDWNETDAAANNRRWRFEAQAEQFLARVVNDANSAAVTWMTVDRTANVVDDIIFTVGSNTTTLSSSQVNTNQQFRSTKDWALNNLLNYGVLVSSNNPAIALQEADAAANNGVWDIAAIAEQLLFRTVSDGVVSTVNWMVVDRTGTTVDSVTFPSQVVGTLVQSAGAPTSAVYLNSNLPALGFREADAAANNRLWDIVASGEQMLFRAANDAVSTTNNWMVVDRTGVVLDRVTFPNCIVSVTAAFSPNVAGINAVNLGTQNNGGSIAWANSTGGADSKYWDMYTDTSFQEWRLGNDALGAFTTWMRLDRTGTTASTLAFTATTIRLNTTTATTVGAAGGASALPATPTGYLTVNVNGTAQKIPYYAT